MHKLETESYNVMSSVKLRLNECAAVSHVMQVKRRFSSFCTPRNDNTSDMVDVCMFMFVYISNSYYEIRI